MQKTTLADRILADFGASFWLKKTIRELRQRDPIDARNDACALADAMRELANIALSR